MWLQLAMKQNDRNRLQLLSIIPLYKAQDVCIISNRNYHIKEDKQWIISYRWSVGCNWIVHKYEVGFCVTASTRRVKCRVVVWGVIYNEDCFTVNETECQSGKIVGVNKSILLQVS